MRYVFILIIFAVSLAACNDKKATSEEFMSIDDSQMIKKVYFDSGELFTEQYYTKNGGETLANGLRKTFYENGAIESVSLYRMGKLDSIQTFFYKNGKIVSVYNNSLGTPIGTMIDYYENG